MFRKLHLESLIQRTLLVLSKRWLTGQTWSSQKLRIECMSSTPPSRFGCSSESHNYAVCYLNLCLLAERFLLYSAEEDCWKDQGCLFWLREGALQGHSTRLCVSILWWNSWGAENWWRDWYFDQEHEQWLFRAISWAGVETIVLPHQIW